MKPVLLLLLAAVVVSGQAHAKDLVTKETVRTAKKETKKFRLENKIPVNYRKIEGSDILHIYVGFHSGTRDLSLDDKPQARILFSAMGTAAEGYPKEKLYAETEKYGLILGCTGGIETSNCQLGAISDYWEEGLDLLAAVINSPSLEDEDIKLEKDRLVASLKSEMSDPSSYVNNTVNKVFYPDNHPFAGTYEELLEATPNVKREDLQKLHAKILSADNINIAVVGNIDEDKLTKALSKRFGKIPNKKYERVKVAPPEFNEKRTFAFENRDIPTAYIRAKFNVPGVTDDDAVPSKFLLRVLSEELGDEIRTRQSLSYAVYSYAIQFSAGIGVISASTSKPKETLAAIEKVVNKVKNERYTKTELDNHKRIYTTRYYLTQEEHSSLAGALAQTELWFGTTDPLYEMPMELDRVTPRDIQALAKKLLLNFRVGVVYDKDKFKEDWAESLIKFSMGKKKKSKKNKKKKS